MAAVHQHFIGLADELFVSGELNLALAFVQNREAAALFRFRDGVWHVPGGGVGPRRVFEREDGVVLRGVQQRKSVGEVLFGLAGEADDDVRGDADGAARGADPGDLLEIFFAGVSAQHFAQHAGGTGLHRQVHVVAERRNVVNRRDDLAVKIIGMRSGEAHAANSRNGGDGAQQVHKIPLTRRGIAIRIHGLAEQLDLGVASIGEAARFGEHSLAGAAAFRSPGVRDDAVGAGVIATFDNGDVGTQAIDRGG